MPNAAVFEAARPKCHKRPEGMKSLLCNKPMRWDELHGTWRCPEHGAMITGTALVERQNDPVAA